MTLDVLITRGYKKKDLIEKHIMLIIKPPRRVGERFCRKIN